jgi:hypothetical protein
MNAKTLKVGIIAFAALAGVLLAVNLVVYARQKAVVQDAPAAVRSAPKQTAPASSPLVPDRKPGNTPAPAFSWQPIESSDYKAYIANLRKLSFPEELIREIIVADIEKLYAPREEPLKWKPAPYDASLAERRKQPTTQDIKNLMQLRDLQVEKQGILRDLLGVTIPRDILRTPNSRNYEGYEYALSQLPPEKREAVQRLQEDEFLNDDLNQTKYNGYGSAPEVQEYRALNDRIHAEFQKIMTPDEYDRYMMNSMPPGTEMARRIIGMEPTDEEMLKIWHLTDEQWREEGGVYGRWHAERRTPDQITAANEKLQAGLKEALGDDRYLDYQMAVSETGQQLRNLTTRYDLPRETLAEAFQLQSELDRFGRRAPADAAQVQRLSEQLQQTLGPDVFESWNAGRKLKYDIQPY